MKKIIIGLVVLSALSFGAMKSDKINMNNNCQRGTRHSQMMDGLSESQQNELTSMMESKREANYKKSLNLRTKQLELEKLLSNDEINWKSVEKVNNQISDMRSEQSLDNMKFRKELEEKFGITMGHRHKGMNGNHRHMGNGMRDKNHREDMGNGMRDKNHREDMGNKMKDKNHREHMGNRMMDGLSESQQNELTSMMESKREANYKESLNLRIKKLELEKLLSNDEINWKSVEKVNNQISDMRSEQSLDNMKFRKELEEKFGITMGHRHKGMNGNHGHMGNGMKDEAKSY